MAEGFIENYARFVLDRLAHVCVTDGAGEEIPSWKGTDIWAGRARQIELNKKGLIFFCGNGASASMAEHMSHDWFQNAGVNTLTCAEVSHLTAIGNDIGYENVYSYRIGRILTEDDMLVAISSSGNSPNIVNAVKTAKEKGAFTVTLSGMECNNRIKQMGDLNFYVPLAYYGEIESAHAVLLHSILDYYLESYKGGRH